MSKNPPLRTRMAVAAGLVRDKVSSSIMSNADLHKHLQWVAEFAFNSVDQKDECKALLYMAELAMDMAERL